MRMRRWGWGALAAAACAFAAPAARAADPAGEVVAVLGAAEYVRAEGQAPEKLVTGEKVFAGGRVRTGADSRVHIRLADGTFLQLAGGSDVAVSECVRGPSGALLRGRIDLLMGKILAVLEKIPADASFSVETDNATAGVRGTTFAVDYRLDGGTPATRVYVFSGGVQVTNRRTGARQLLRDRAWVELLGARTGPVLPADEAVKNGLMDQFRAARAAVRGDAGGAGKKRLPSSLEGQAPNISPEVQVRTQYISPGTLSVPPSAPAAAGVVPGPAPQPGGGGGTGLRQTQDRGAVDRLLH